MDRGSAEATTGGSVLRSGLWATASRLLPQLYTLVVSGVAARALGPDGMGRQSLIAFAAVFATTAATLGLPTALVRHVGEAFGAGRAETLRPLVSAAWKIETVAALIGASALIGIGLSGQPLRDAWILTGLVCGLSVLQKVAASVLVGLQNWRAMSIITLAVGTAGSATTILVLLLGGGVTAMIAVGAASTVLALIWTSFQAQRLLRRVAPEASRDPALNRRTWRYAAVASVGVPVTLIVWFRSEFFFLAHYSSDRQIALYSIAFSASTALVIVPQTIGNVLAPAFATLHGAQSRARMRSGFGRACRLLLTMTIPLTGAAAALGPETLRLVYGSAYHDTVPVFLIMLCVLPFVPLLQLSMAFLFGIGLQWVPTFVGAAAAGVDLGLAYLLIPHHGAVGAALANAGGQLVLTVPVVAYATRTAGGIAWELGALTGAILATLVASLCSLAAVLWIGGLGGLALGSGAFLVGFIAVGHRLAILSAQDAAWVAASSNGRTRLLLSWVSSAAA